jgi:hypothetical protein
MSVRVNCLAWLLTGTLVATVTPARAQESIGIAIIIRNDVNGTLSSRTFRINAGESVFRQESVSTNADSSAKLVFADSTNLAVGPNSSVTLDKFVYAGATDYKQATMQLVKGAFRFTTGNSDKRAYEIKTHVATIGVRGTKVDALVVGLPSAPGEPPAQTTATLQADPPRRTGSARVCNPKILRCVILSKPGETAVVTETSITKQDVGGWNFAANYCTGDPALCEVTTLASTQPTSPPSYDVTTAPSGQPTTTVTQPTTTVTQPTTTVTQPTTTVTQTEVLASPLGAVGSFAVLVGVGALAIGGGKEGPLGPFSPVSP